MCDLGEKYNKKVIIYHLKDTVSSERIDGVDTNRYPIEAYFRLFVTKFLPSDLHKVIYLDCDMVVCKNLTPLWNTDLDGYAIGAVTDYHNDNMEVYTRLKYDPKYGYINTGMLLINMDYWRTNNVIDLFKDYIKNNPDKLVFADQDVLNPLFYDKKKILPICYNLSTAFLFKPQLLSISSRFLPEIEEAFNNPTIIHYTTDRPWFKNCSNPMLHYWEKYRDMTIWKGQTMDQKKLSIKRRVIHLYVYLKRLWLLSSINRYDKKYIKTNKQ